MAKFSLRSCQLLNSHGIFVDTWTSIPDHFADKAVFFLTHFHADHMQGLSANFRFRSIYCSHHTRLLLLARFPSLKEVVVGCNYCETMVHRASHFDLCFTMFDARHCSGSAMILFECTQIGRILHTGDFRFDNQAMLEVMMPYLSTSRLDHLVLDATFCSQRCPEFPSKQGAAKAVIDLIEKAPSQQKVVISLQPLGAEPIIEAICSKFGCQVHLDFPSTDVQIFLALPFFEKYCTLDDELRFCICCPKRFKEITDRRFDTGVNIGPLLIKTTTMWFAQERLCHRPVIESEPNIYRILYSMHSSLTEVREFVRQVIPKDVSMSALPFDFDPNASDRQHQENLEKLVGGRYRRCAGGQDEFFKKLVLPARAFSPENERRDSIQSPEGAAIPVIEPITSLTFFKDSSIMLHSQLDASSRHQAVILVAKLGARRVTKLSVADVVIIDSSKPDAWRALRRIVNSASQMDRNIRVFDSAALNCIGDECSISAIEEQFLLWSSSQLTADHAAQLAEARRRTQERRACLSPFYCTISNGVCFESYVSSFIPPAAFNLLVMLRPSIAFTFRTISNGTHPDPNVTFSMRVSVDPIYF